eukprot:375227-Pelagomonas_calceolata.AAC.1
MAERQQLMADYFVPLTQTAAKFSQVKFSQVPAAPPARYTQTGPPTGGQGTQGEFAHAGERLCLCGHAGGRLCLREHAGEEKVNTPVRSNTRSYTRGNKGLAYSPRIWLISCW